MRLTEFIRNNHPPIAVEWERFAGTLFPEFSTLSRHVLRDHIEKILDAIVLDMESYQSTREQADKSHGSNAKHVLAEVGQIHAQLRIESGFQISQLVAEYRALRASILQLWTNQGDNCGPQELQEVTRFNESIDEALTEATNRYVQTMNRYRDLFLGILSHDLRNPLGGILMSATMMTRSDALDDKTLGSATRIVNSAKRMSRMVNDLLDLTRVSLSGEMPLNPVQMDLRPVCRQVLAELESFHVDSKLQFECKGNLDGEWDGDRLAQMLSNLVANAIQHGAKKQPIRVVASADGQEVLLEVHNEGPAIPDNVRPTMFEPMVRHPTQDDVTSSSLGLGLFIAREVVTAHGGKLTVASTDNEGTTFTVRLPRRSRTSTLTGGRVA